MFCTNCGGKLREGAKFCGSCGTKLEAGAGAGKPGNVERIDLAPLAGDLPQCQIAIREVTAEGPDEERCYRVNVKYEVTNDSDEDWEYLVVRMQLLNAEGQAVEESSDSHEQTISAGESEEFEGGFWGVNAALLGVAPDKAHVVVSVAASTFARVSMGKVSIPEAAFSPVQIKAVDISDVVKGVSAGLWKTEADGDGDSRVEAKVLVQNLTDKWLPQVKVTAEVSDKSGRELCDAGGYEEVRPGAIATIGGSGYVKYKKLAGATAELSLGAYTPVAVGITQTQGMVVAASEVDSSEQEDEPDTETSFEGGEEGKRSSTLNEGALTVDTFYMMRFGVAEKDASGDFLDNQAEGLWLAVAECSADEILVVYSEQTGLHIFEGEGLSEAVKEIASRLSQKRIAANVFPGLVVSTFEQDADGLLDVDENFEARYFEAVETEDVSEYAPCAFGIGSISRDVDGVVFDKQSKKLIHDGEELDRPSDLYGRIDESETWVIGLRGGNAR